MCVLWMGLSVLIMMASSFVPYRSLGKFTVGYFGVRIIRGKIFLSLEVSKENFLTIQV